ncbi:hypothetical protein B0T12DRAFT_37286 [Alternaria alternata]|nr:hypothetical protein B0T12DRAFT_37286 [Alternaria alternata]
MYLLQPVIYPLPQMQVPLQAGLLPAPLPNILPLQQHLPQEQLLLPPRPLLQPQVPLIQKTLYVTTYSSEVLERQLGAEVQLLQYIPHVPALLTIYCQTWRAPPRKMCEMYSGVSQQIQQFIMGSRTAVREIKKALASIVNHFNAGHQVASIQTTCHAGTHRSVGTAEIVAKEMRRMGVNVVIKHLHRRRRPGDPW